MKDEIIYLLDNVQYGDILNEYFEIIEAFVFKSLHLLFIG
jgi:hypothetical protein